MDDVLMSGKTQKEHNQRLSEFLAKIQEAGLMFNDEKCTFSQTRVSFLGHAVEETGVYPHPDKLRAIQKILTTTNVTEVC